MARSFLASCPLPLGLAMLGVALLPARPAVAALDERGAIIISVDRLFGLTNSASTTESGSTETTRKRTDLSLFTGYRTTPYNLPRLALDVSLGALTLGGSLGIAYGSPSTSVNNNGVTSSADQPDSTTLVLAPRAGWVRSLGPMLGVWLRGGFTYFRESAELSSVGDARVTTSGFSINLEPNLTLMLADRFGFIVGLVLDLPLTGETERSSGSTRFENDNSVRNLGLMVGVLGRL